MATIGKVTSKEKNMTSLGSHKTVPVEKLPIKNLDYYNNLHLG